MQNKLWVVSELYYPEETSTGYLLTKIAEGLSERHSVNVLCAQPTYTSRGVRAPAYEKYNGVTIYRCKASTLNKDVMLFRLVNNATIGISLFIQLLRRINRRDCVLVVTNPPVLPFLAGLACRLRGTKYLLLIHDVYPEVLIATGMIRAQSLLGEFGAWLTKILYFHSERLIVLGRDMKELVIKKIPVSHHGRVVMIPNWADIQQITPASRHNNELLETSGLRQKFVVQYAGNMGYSHGLETIMDAAEKMSINDHVHFLFIGSGAKSAWIAKAAKRHNLQNITLLQNRPRSDQQNFLNACDVAIISFIPGMAGVSVPSRMYNIMAAGKPIIAVADDHAELSMVITEEGIGWVVPPNRPDILIKTILAASADRDALIKMGSRARAVAESKYTLDIVIKAYDSLIREIETGD